jgi:hypothetical protein
MILRKSPYLMTDPIAIDYTKRPWFKIGFWLFFILTIYNFFYNGILASFQSPNIDFKIYYYWSTHIQDGYPYLKNGLFYYYPSFYYPPFWGWLISPLTHWEYETARQIWNILNIFWMVLFFSMVIEWFKNRPLFKESWYLWGFMLVALSFSPYLESMRHGQANIVILFLLTAVFWLYSRDKKVIAGMFLGLATMIKIMPIVLIIYWGWKREWKLVLSALATLLFLGLSSLAILGWRTHYLFLQDNNTYINFIKDHWLHQGNSSVYSFLREGQSEGYFPRFLPMYQIAMGIAVLLALFLAYFVPRKNLGLKTTGLEYSLVLASMFLATTYTEHHQFMILLLAYAWVWCYMDELDSIPAKFLMAGAWVLIAIGYSLSDFNGVLINRLLSLYYHTIGVGCIWIALMLFLRGQYKIEKVNNTTGSA